MNHAFVTRFRLITVLCGAAVLVSASTLAWLGYKTVTEWRESAVQLATQRATETATLAASAITRDMRGAQQSLAGWRWEEGEDVTNLVVTTFARYPYPEWFFVWQPRTPSDRTMFYARRERLPSWLVPIAKASGVPVMSGRAPGIAQALTSRIAKEDGFRRHISVFDLEIEGAPYQVVARVVHDDAFHVRAVGAFGFAVNKMWARQQYFQDIAAQVARIGGVSSDFPIAVADASGNVVAGLNVKPLPTLLGRRAIPLLFFDPLVVAVDPPSDLAREFWSVDVFAGNDRTLQAVRSGARFTMMVAAVSCVVLAIGFMLIGRAWRTQAELVDMKTELIASVTHELKTPLASIRAASERLAAGRVLPPDLPDYGGILLSQSKRLIRLVDNVLAYARITDVAQVYNFELLSLREFIEAALEEFAVQLESGQFHLGMNVPEELPLIRVDRTAFGLAFDNLLDNAIRYSPITREIAIIGRQENSSVILEVSDRGGGISEDEIGQVTRRFFRGRRAGSSGSGLGLAIVQRIVTDHGGSVRIRSAVGEGTTVTVILPGVLLKDGPA